MAAIFRYADGSGKVHDDSDKQRVYLAKGGGETTDRKQARKQRGCAVEAALRETAHSEYRYFCDCSYPIPGGRSR